MTEATKDRPIIFSGEMVRAILAGRKTQTRRIVKPQPAGEIDNLGDGNSIYDFTTGNAIAFPYGFRKDRLWVRETWNLFVFSRDAEHCWPVNKIPPRWPMDDEPIHTELHYAATTDEGPWRPSIHMPRWASRITLEITDIRVERLQDISEADAIAEGVEPNCAMINHSNCSEDDHGGEWLRYPVDQWDTPAFSAKESFQSLWESINGPGSWDANPWVWVVEFKRITP